MAASKLQLVIIKFNKSIIHSNAEKYFYNKKAGVKTSAFFHEWYIMGYTENYTLNKCNY